MANYDSYPERRSKSKDRARDKPAAADKVKVVRVRVVIKDRVQIKVARARVSKVAGVAAVEVGIRISETVSEPRAVATRS